MSKGGAFDYLIKMIIIGDSGVGKTCFLLRFSDENFTSSHIATIGNLPSIYYSLGIDFKIKTIPIDGKQVKLQIWDTAGQERFRTITQTYYKGAMGIVLAYDCTSEESFENVRNWVKQIEQHAMPNVKKILVGNKADLEDHKMISTQQGE